jgi:hypothetical protein
VAGRDAAPLLEPIETALDGIAVLPPDPLALRRAIWSLRSGIVCLIPQQRNSVRVLGCEYALSASNRKSRPGTP